MVASDTDYGGSWIPPP